MTTKLDNQPTQLSKANILTWLKPKLRSSYVEDIYVCTVDEWMSQRSDVLRKVIEKFQSQTLVVRSSSMKEDGWEFSQAGCFTSVLNVTCKENSITEAMEKVIASYSKVGFSAEDQILIQSQTSDVEASGVLFTRQLGTNAPYYVINYDDDSGKTDTVTGGLVGQTTYISHFASDYVDEKWKNLLIAVEEIKSLFTKGSVLDVEFAITKKGKVVIFQVRPLAANKDAEPCDDEFIEHLLKDMTEKFNRYSQSKPNIAGDFTVFGDMPDWNPSEIIGERPNTLDYTLYSFIVTDEIWHEARSSLGYYDVFPAELMTSFGKKPYIDTRLSFNSFTPADISQGLRIKLVHYYLEKLKKNPAYQDKVEFEILWTCYDFSTQKELESLKDHGFSSQEIEEFCSSIKNLTVDILDNYKNITKQDMRMVRYLTDRRNEVMNFYNKEQKSPWNTINTAYNILQNCKRFGTLPFSRQARLGFIAKAFMTSLLKEKGISQDFYNYVSESIHTVASEFREDSIRFSKEELTEEEFLNKYGHLRAGTYDITADRYDHIPNFMDIYKRSEGELEPRKDLQLASDVKASIEKALKAHGISTTVEDLLEFVRTATENREYAKFEFTKSLSDAIELIAEAGEMLGFKRDEFCHADWPTIMKFRNPEKGDLAYAQKMIKASIDRHKSERQWYNSAILPAVISSAKDFYVVEPYQAQPNFITLNAIEGDVCLVDRVNELSSKDLTQSILLLENADPGYDWVFAKQPKGIVTKYGGVASHISIRCAEFDIPAAIGCGEIIYQKLKSATRITLDCDKKSIKPVII